MTTCSRTLELHWLPNQKTGRRPAHAAVPHTAEIKQAVPRTALALPALLVQAPVVHPNPALIADCKWFGLWHSMRCEGVSVSLACPIETSLSARSRTQRLEPGGGGGGIRREDDGGGSRRARREEDGGTGRERMMRRTRKMRSRMRGDRSRDEVGGRGKQEDKAEEDEEAEET